MLQFGFIWKAGVRGLYVSAILCIRGGTMSPTYRYSKVRARDITEERHVRSTTHDREALIASLLQ